MPPSKRTKEYDALTDSVASLTKTTHVQAGIIARMQTHIDELVAALRMLTGQPPRASPLENKSLARTNSSGAQSLTEREQQVARLMADGRTSTQIADELVLEYDTIKAHRANIYRKLGIHSLRELVATREQWEG